ncbi:MAG TPA: cytochrome B5 [Lactobacillus sp.]|nr:cytochrome B5 [Lactobacillus sp.]
MQNLTADELKQFDGQDGRKAYVAVDGTIYDLSGVDAWQGGQHHGLTAGKDLTEMIKKSPHGKKVLEDKPVVGKLV